jgi:hypothetical protein
METLYEDELLLLKGINKSNVNTCIVSFTGVGHAMGGLDVQKEEFVGSALKNGSVFFVTDKSRSWSNKISLEKLLETFSKFGFFENLISIGNSMGGTNALLLGPRMGCKTIIAFTPQYSVNPDIFPDLKNKKWMKYRDSIQEWPYKTVDDALCHPGKEYIIHGDDPLELMHAQKFAHRSNRVHLILKNCGHDISMSLKKKDALSKVIDSCIVGSCRHELIELLSSFGVAVHDSIRD